MCEWQRCFLSICLGGEKGIRTCGERAEGDNERTELGRIGREGMSVCRKDTDKEGEGKTNG